MPLKSRTARVKAASLFSSAGIGEIGIEAAGLEIVLANELIASRAALYRANFAHEMLEGDISEKKEEFIQRARARLGTDELFLLYATPPCQGMSTNGMGKLKSEVASGRRNQEDQRNRLVIPAMDIAVALKPRWLLLENVPGMEATEIRTNGQRWENIISYVRRRLGRDYVGGAQVIACEDFGIPQRRKRLITVFTRDAGGKMFYESNGGSFFSPDMEEQRVTLRDAIGSAPPLDAKAGHNEARWFHPYHYVPVMTDLKYHWVKHTKEGNTAFNNQCVNPDCRSPTNPGHKDVQVDGKWVSSKEIPIYCHECGHLLPRPHVLEAGKARLLRGFHSAYRRMKWDETARTLTQNFIYEASDNKIHPSQNRVLSVYEAMVLQSIDRYEYTFQINGKDISTAQIAEVIGESVPPYLIEKICRMMVSASSSVNEAPKWRSRAPSQLEIA